jgi:hypothetical protein
MGMSTRTPVPLVLYEREGCHLCEEMLAVVESLRSEFALDVQCVDIGGSGDLEARFGTEIPVLFVAGRKAFKYRVTPLQLRERIQRALA